MATTAGTDAPPHRVLVVDDSAVARQAISRAIRDAGMEIVGRAGNGREGLDQVRALTPDLVVLDLEMPEMDGMEFLRRLRAEDDRLPVVVFSALSAEGAEATLAAMSAGATAFALKPSALLGEGPGDVQSELVPVITSVLGQGVVKASPVPPRTTRSTRTAPVEVVVIAVSTGGPNALVDVIGGLPASLGVPVLVVQHMPASFTSLLAQRLDAACDLSVTEGSDGDLLLPGHVYIAPGGRHMVVERHGARVRVGINDGPRENSCRPAADVLFRSAAQVYGHGVLAVVLTGMGQDGLAGSRAVVGTGGIVVAQDPATAVVGTMPESVVRADLVDAVVPLAAMADEIVERTTGTRPNT